MRKLVISAVMLAALASGTVAAERAGRAPAGHEHAHGDPADMQRLEACQRRCSDRFDACGRNADVQRYQQCQASFTACASACGD